MSAALVNYEVRRKEKQSSSNDTSAEALTASGRSFNQKKKEVHRRSKSKPNFRDLKKNQCVFCKILGHQKVDCLRIKDTNKESKTDANLAHVMDRTQTQW